MSAGDFLRVVTVLSGSWRPVQDGPRQWVVGGGPVVWSYRSRLDWRGRGRSLGVRPRKRVWQGDRTLQEEVEGWPTRKGTCSGGRRRGTSRKGLVRPVTGRRMDLGRVVASGDRQEGVGTRGGLSPHPSVVPDRD